MDKAMRARIRARKRRYYLYRLKILFWKWLALLLGIWVVYQMHSLVLFFADAGKQ